MVEVECRAIGRDLRGARVVESATPRCGTFKNPEKLPYLPKQQGPPMPLFETDRADIEAVSGRAYQTMRSLLFQKEAAMQEIEGRITELKLSLSD